MTSSQNKALHFPSPFRTLALKSLPVKTWDTHASLTQYDDAIENHTRFKTIMLKIYPCFRKQVKHRSMWGDVFLPPPPPLVPLGANISDVTIKSTICER